MSLIYLFLLLSPILLSVKTSGEETSIGCYVPGRCENSETVDIEAEVPTPSDCLTFCNDTEDCNYFTHDPLLNFCVAYSTCVNFSTVDCPDCVSGDSDCPPNPCFLPGGCRGTLMGLTREDDQEECRKTCRASDEMVCETFSFDTDGDICSLWVDCEVDATCTTCSYGDRDCDLPAEPALSKLFIVAGNDCTSDTSDAEVIDLASTDSVCEKPANYPFPVSGPVSGLVNNALWVCGGWLTNQCYNYDGDTNNWQPAGGMSENRYWAASTIRRNGTEMWVVGGVKGSEQIATNYLDSTEFLLDGEFRYGPDLPEPMAFTCLVTINSSHVFLAGGRLATLQPTSEAYIINLDGGEGWKQVQDMSIPRNYHMCGLITTEDFGDEVIVIGGLGSSTTEIFSLTNHTWRVGPNFPHTIHQSSVVPFEDSLLVVGGYTGPCRDEIYKLNLEYWSWVEMSSTLTKPRHRMVAILVPDTMVDCHQ